MAREIINKNQIWPLKEAKILIVDNESINSEVIQIHLENAGYKNIICSSAPKQAVEIIKAEQPNLLLVAMMMPGISGIDVLEAMQTHDQLKNTSVIIITSSTDSELKQRALGLGVSDFLSRPIDESELILRVKNTLMAKAYEGSIQDRASGVTYDDAKDHRTTTDSEESAKRSGALVCQLSLENPRIRALVERFRVRLSDQLNAMGVAWQERNFEELSSLAHWLKGAGGTVGYLAFTDPARELELLAKAKKENDIEGAIAALHELAHRIVLPGE